MSENLQKTPTSTWSDLEFLLSGPQTIEEVLNEAIIREAERRGVEQGKKQLLAQIEAEVREHLKKFFDSILTLAKKVQEQIRSKFPAITIIDFKTFLLPFSDELNLFVIFDDMPFEKDIEVGFLLSEIERHFLAECNSFCEIHYARKTANLDIASIKRDYPFTLKV